VADRPPVSAGDTDFDDWKDQYADAIVRTVPFLPQDHDFYMRTKAEDFLETAEERLGPVEAVHALDVGCGIGLMHRHIARRLARLDAVDIAEGSLEQARASNPGVEYRLYDGQRLGHDDAHVDLAFAMGVIHHVPPAGWTGFLRELVRVTRPGGLVMLVEPNLLNPICRFGASRCEFDQDATFIRAPRLRRMMRAAGLRDVQVRYILFVPIPFPGRRAIERRLRWLPIGAQYIVSGRVTSPA
jgi:SAM-dependent methyltransferase